MENLKAGSAGVKFFFASNGAEMEKLLNEFGQDKQVFATQTGVTPSQNGYYAYVYFGAKPAIKEQAKLSSCSSCNATISQKVSDFSTRKFGKKLCMKCQAK